MIPDIDKYSYLWDGSQGGWVLLVAPDLQGGFCIFNELTSKLFHMDDEQLNVRLCERMKTAGCKVIDSLPRKVPPIEAKPIS